MAVSSQIVESMKNSSWIRKMFEAGAELAAKYGAENVFDFTLGNPNIEPPAEFEETLINYINGGFRNARTLPARSAPSCPGTRFP